MRDFTLKIYRQLLETLLQTGYGFIRFDEFAVSSLSADKSQVRDSGSESQMTVIMRHDVDRKPMNALLMAKLEKEIGIKGTYYFRIVPESFDERIIKEIASLGHEIGYHYEEIDTAYRQLKMNNEKLKIGKSNGTVGQSNNDTSTPLSMTIDLAYKLFKVNLAKLREAAEVKTICMHGSPLSPYDNKIIWQKYSYKDLGIIGEPYLDIDWTEFGYLTDTGRRWDGSSVSVRDKVESALQGKRLKASSSILPQRGRRFRITQDIIENVDVLPEKLMITIHPQRWSDNYLERGKELVLQNLKNVVKKIIVKRRNAGR